ncbi:hypothetical protein M409DRAFT_54510 [Zasmidium cellare ATCC 36951]|uniref:Uncharacterized protein n=1 Tax=Zasmidium cellare ATCC 36951 TaxID=1080233 RepID=A0A6A6CHI7_ZASCE|nr:uncharacterized protein M409DRAFT_54510 [Zasmidium cellare ATCC 36951]KAF2166717.1 hypothetical protein M409DRAFT_54510 [Zasmidium cellare ATCC 36951]
MSWGSVEVYDSYPAVAPAKYVGTLKGKVAVVTGASTGIGRAIAKAFVAAGASVAAIARRQPELDSLVNEVHAAANSSGRLSTIVPIVADLTANDAGKRIVTEVEQDLGPIDILINNAGGLHVGLLGEEEDADSDLWWKSYQINLGAPLALISAVLPSMRRRKTGVILNTSAAGVTLCAPALSAQCASKAALSKLTEVLAADMQFAGCPDILAFAVNPGTVKTEGCTYVLDPNKKYADSIMTITVEKGISHPVMQTMMSSLPGDIKMKSSELCADVMVALAADPAYRVLNGLHLNASEPLPLVLEEAQKEGKGRIGAERLYTVKVDTLNFCM